MYYINNNFYRYHNINWINYGLVVVQVIVADTIWLKIKKKGLLEMVWGEKKKIFFSK